MTLQYAVSVKWPRKMQDYFVRELYTVESNKIESNF